MAEVKKTSRVIDTWKAKRWYKILSPAVFGSREIGETMASEEQLLLGRTMSVSLAMVTGDMKKQSTNIVFEIKNIKSGVAETVFKRLEIAPSSVRRMIRKGKDRIDMSIICATNDKGIFRIKPLVITRSQAGGTILAKLRKLIEDALRVEVNKVNSENLLIDVVTGKLQRSVRQRLNKVYPVKQMEIRALEHAVIEKPLPPIPILPEFKKEVIEETEEEKIEKKVKAKEKGITKEDLLEEVEVEKPKKVKKAEA